MRLKNRGFTIVEILVVLIIVMILSTLLFPAFVGAKRKAKSTVCISNLRQVYIALQLYREDHGEYPPNSFEHQAFRAYYPTILVCPESRDERHAYDYLAMWFFSASPEDSPTHQEYVAAWQRCRETRAGSLPIAMDRNHVSRETTIKSGTILLLREAGAVESVSAPREQVTIPCQVPPLGSHFNL